MTRLTLLSARAVRIAVLPACLVAAVGPARAESIRFVTRPADPYGAPRPAPGAVHVPPRTSLYFELGLPGPDARDRILPESVTVAIESSDGTWSVSPLRDGVFAEGVRGWMEPRPPHPGNDPAAFDAPLPDGLAVYVDPGTPLPGRTRFAVRVTARTERGVELTPPARPWRFATAAPDTAHEVAFELDLATAPVRWHGGFFSGICQVVFCTRESMFSDTFALMREARERHPRAWSYQRDIWLTAVEDRKPSWHFLLDPLVPNIVREKETRRVAAVKARDDGLLLTVEDFFGHEQYGIASGRPLTEDYAPGDTVLLADGITHARSEVLAVDDQARTLRLAPVETPADAWKLAYQFPPPDTADPDAPGRFAAGGTHVRKFDPPGTPVYFWDRLNKEWDLAHRRDGRRLVVNFVAAPADLSIDAHEYSPPKDYAQWHDVVHTIAGHVIDRYGDAALDFAWSVFNEPDIIGLHWRHDWTTVLTFYDYTVDAILRAFEDRGYDADRVSVGGLELAAIFRTNMRLEEFLVHCSPASDRERLLPGNAAFADARLDGRRSRRVEDLCQANAGRGSPCDFISIHTYNRAEMAAAKLIRAKEIALEIDEAYYAELWVNSHESCPNWSPPPDEAAADSYLGNGYFPSWCLDVVHRQLDRAQTDPRYAFGESVLTIWPPAINVHGLNTITRILRVDDTGDGRMDRAVTVPNPVFHAMGLLSDLGPDFWTLPRQTFDGHEVAGFASRDADGVIRIALSCHNAADTESRSDHTVAVQFDLLQAGWSGPARLMEYRFDRDRHSFFHLAKSVRDGNRMASEADAAWLESLHQRIAAAPPGDGLRILQDAEISYFVAARALFPLIQRLGESDDPVIVQELRQMMAGVFDPLGKAGETLSAEIAGRIQRKAQRQPVVTQISGSDANSPVTLRTTLAANGIAFLILEPAP